MCKNGLAITNPAFIIIFIYKSIKRQNVLKTSQIKVAIGNRMTPVKGLSCTIFIELKLLVS